MQYFQRNEWAGRLRVGDDWILDSPANNAHAHYVMNALWLAGAEPDAAASPESVRAELWRAHHIESADTVSANRDGGGVHVRLFVTHAGGAPNGPAMHISADNGRVYWLTDEGRTTVRYADGRQELFDNRSHSLWRYDGFKNFVDAINGRGRVICTRRLRGHRPLQ